MRTAPALHELQRRFLAALYGEETHAPTAIAATGLDAAARLRIYRHAGTRIHVDALCSTFPAVLALVGAAFFERTAARYRDAHPSRSGNLQIFGADFPDFLAILPEARTLPYLADVARLEWLRQHAALAGDAEPLTAAACGDALAHIDGPLRITLHPCVQRLASRHPVLTLWRHATQPDPGRLFLPQTGEHVLLWRDDGTVAMAVIDIATCACIDALARGFTLDAAHAEALRLDPGFELATCIADLVTRGLITGLRGAGDTP